MDTIDGWLDIDYRVFADFPRVFFVHTSHRWLFASASFAESQEDSAPFDVYDMGELSPTSLGRDWRVAPERARSLLGRVTLGPESFDETLRHAVSVEAMRQFLD